MVGDRNDDGDDKDDEGTERDTMPVFERGVKGVCCQFW